MDSMTFETLAPAAAARPARSATGGMPPEARVPMPAQKLCDAGTPRAFVDVEHSRSPRWRRVAVLGGTAVVTAAAVYEMGVSLSVGGISPLEALVVLLFAINLGWITLTFVSAAIGATVIALRRQRPSLTTPLVGRTAVLMPTYNENPERVFAAIEAMATGVRALGEDGTFDWFILSDTTDPAIALAEETAFIELRNRLGGEGAPLYYRRRRRNIARKAGNIADFCKRWGGAYDYLLVLDADSLMEPASIVELARRMEADRDAGLIQTVPRLVHGRTVFARLHQFASRIYGPAIATGLAWWVGSEGNYWGHNAIIRRRAFTEAAGLPDLPGKPPFGGHILSHDFVEAALIRRAGWTVKIADDIQGSYEETPPSLVDFAIRDRRWCQGNLQHVGVLRAAGLHWVSRFHLVSGILSYLASFLWLLLILAGFALAVQGYFTPPDYFSDPHQLFPTWPQIDSALQLRLLALTALLLLGPKIFGFLTVLLSRKKRLACGGGLRLTGGFLFEVVLSALMAPITMLIQSGVVLSILRGKDAGWKPQQRDGGGITWAQAFRWHRWHMVAGIGLALSAWMISPMMVAWLSPLIVGLMLSVPFSIFTSSPWVGSRVRRLGLLTTPEESAPPRIGSQVLTVRPIHRAIVARSPDIRVIVSDDWHRQLHLALVDVANDRQRGDIDTVTAMTAAKLGEAESLDEALASLRPEEQAVALATPTLFTRLSDLGALSVKAKTPEPEAA
jgi:membrane glycosyltransferase